MTYRQITSEQRYTLAVLLTQELNQAQIARALGCDRSTVCRELQRNRCAYDGAYRAEKASERTRGRRSRSRRNQRFTNGEWCLVKPLLREQWSPEQVSGYLRETGELSISHETIYQRIWQDKREGGTLHRHLRGATKQRRKRYGRYDSRGRLAGKRLISERPAAVEGREEPGHWEIDTVMGHATSDCVVTLVERTTGEMLIGKLCDRTKEALTDRVIKLIRGHAGPFRTITADNGTEFHDYRRIERATDVTFYFARPYHSWERGTNENANGLLRQYLPKRQSMLGVTQHRCNAIAAQLNRRPRKRHGFKSPRERMNEI